jgi:glycosyltransferase involved in cell wall biosynthesis
MLESGLTDRGHEVVLLHYEDVKPFKTRWLQKIVDRTLLPNFIAIRSRQHWRSGFDVIMVPSGMGFSIFRKLKHQAARPLLVNHIFGLSFFDHMAILSEYFAGRQKLSLLYRFFSARMTIRWEAKAAEEADVTIVMNDRDVDFLRRDTAGGARSLKVAGSVIDEVMTASEHPSDAIRPRGSLLWFGSWTPRKGIFALPAAFNLVLQEAPEATLTIGGVHISEADIRASFSEAANCRISILPKITIAAQIDVFQRCSIFLFPSLSEGFGLALVEAMAMGLAAVTTDAGFAGDSLTHGVDALIVPKASAVHLARAVVKLIQDDGLREAISHNGQLLARTFSEGRMVSGYEDAFLSGLSKRASWGNQSNEKMG